MNVIANRNGQGKVFFFQAEDGIRDTSVTGVQTCALPISAKPRRPSVAVAVRGREPTAGALALVLNLPSGLCLLLILAWPVLYAGWLSLHEVSLRQLRTGRFPFTGLDNYTRLFADEVFWLALSHTVVFVWRTTPFNILLYHAGLRGIPRDYYEAAQVDGATGWRVFWHVTLPLLRPIIAVSLILRTTFAFMVFDEIFAITQGGPGNATWVAAWYTYRAAFQPPFNVGLGSASAWVMALILAVAGLAYARLVGRRLEP